jgi:DNA repair photolyase
MERELGLTRRCLELIGDAGLAVQIITKSDLVTRDADLLGRMRSVVSFTITTLNPKMARRLEPNAPTPERRLKAVEKLSKVGIPVTVRLDPIFPGLNEEEIGRVVRTAAGAGAVHVTASTFKPRPDSWQRMMLAFPDFCKKVKELYFVEGERHKAGRYLPAALRRELLLRVREACEDAGLTFSVCREGMRELNTAPTCDGTHLLQRESRSF